MASSGPCPLGKGLHEKLLARQAHLFVINDQSLTLMMLNNYIGTSIHHQKGLYTSLNIFFKIFTNVSKADAFSVYDEQNISH